MIDNRMCSLYNNIFVHHFFSLTINCMEQHSGPGIHQQRESENKKRWLTPWIFDTKDIWNDKEGETKGCWQQDRWPRRHKDHNIDFPKWRPSLIRQTLSFVTVKRWRTMTLMIATRLPQAHVSSTLPTKDKKGRYLLPHACTSTLTQ